MALLLCFLKKDYENDSIAVGRDLRSRTFATSVKLSAWVDDVRLLAFVVVL